MFKIIALLSWMGAISSVFITALYVNSAVGNTLVHSKQECASCHLAGQGTNKLNASQLISSQEALCGKCHNGALELSHPSGFRPSRALPVDYPLDWKGDLTCSSCHDIHGDQMRLIRGDRVGKQLCLSCHDDSFFVAMADGGTSLQRIGHLSARPNLLERELDPYSIQCMECHEGNGEAPRVKIDNGVTRHTGGTNHPVGVDYDKAARSGTFKDSTQLNDSIKLPQGKVSCVSCHFGYSKKHGALVMPRKDSILCFECHDL